MDRGQALGYARALWAGAWARSLVPQALIPSLSGSGDTLFSLSWKSRHLPPLCVGLSGNGWVRGGGAGRCGPAPFRDPTDPAGLMKHQRKPSHLWLCGRHSGRSVALVVVVCALRVARWGCWLVVCVARRAPRAVGARGDVIVT